MSGETEALAISILEHYSKLHETVSKVDAKVEHIQRDVADLKADRVTRDQFDNHRERIEKLEGAIRKAVLWAAGLGVTGGALAEAAKVIAGG